MAIPFGEFQLPWQSLPLLFRLTGLVVVWTVGVWLPPAPAAETPPAWPPVEYQSRFRYVWYGWGRDRELDRHSNADVKGWLTWLRWLTLAFARNLNWQAEDLRTSFYFSGMLVHSPWIATAQCTILFFMWRSMIYRNAREHAVTVPTIRLTGTLAFFMLVLVSANNRLVFYVALEGVSLLAFVLTALPKTQTSAEAGRKYFIQSSLASVVLLLGIARLFARTQDMDFSVIRLVLTEEPLTELTFAALFRITVARLFKISAFPGQFWAPDVYRGPLASVLTVFAVCVKGAAALARFNIYANFLRFAHAQFSWRRYVSSAASMLLGALGAIRVINERGDLRAFIAYTSINQVGFVRRGRLNFNAEGLVASYVYLVIYLLSSLRFLGTLSRLRLGQYAERPLTRLEDLRHRFARSPYSSRRTDAWILAYSVWSMAGLPPLAGFFGKVALWASLVHKMQDRLSGKSWSEVSYTFTFVDGRFEFDPFWSRAGILVFSVVVSIISATYYFKLYELMAPPASLVELQVKADKPKAWMWHENGTILVTGGLIRLLAAWPVMLYWIPGATFYSFPVEVYDYLRALPVDFDYDAL